MKSQSQCTGVETAKDRRGPNREDAQRRKEAFWMILTSKSGFYRSRSLSNAKTRKRSSVLGLERGACGVKRTLSMTIG